MLKKLPGEEENVVQLFEYNDNGKRFGQVGRPILRAITDVHEKVDSLTVLERLIDGNADVRKIIEKCDQMRIDLGPVRKRFARQNALDTKTFFEVLRDYLVTLEIAVDARGGFTDKASIILESADARKDAYAFADKIPDRKSANDIWEKINELRVEIDSIIRGVAKIAVKSTLGA